MGKMVEKEMLTPIVANIESLNMFPPRCADISLYGRAF